MIFSFQGRKSNSIDFNKTVFVAPLLVVLQLLIFRVKGNIEHLLKKVEACAKNFYQVCVTTVTKRELKEK